MPLEKLSSPPIVEVVCGVAFDPIAGLDPLTLGKFHEQRKVTYPGHQLHPPILDDGPIHFKGTFPPVRAWFISSNDAWVLQIQWDRFYLNWRARSGEYPRFSDHQGQPGVLSKFLTEFGLFAEYCGSEFGVVPKPRSYEVTKIDHFEEGRSWNGLGDLAAMLPWLTPFATASESNAPSIATQFREDRSGGALTVGVEVAGALAKLESRLTGVTAGDLRTSFESANEVLNGVFEKLIPTQERTKRFQGGAK